MSQYVNSHFNIKIDFPETWRFRFWGNRTSKLEFPERYQAFDEDMPSELNEDKVLLTALSTVRRNSLSGTCFYIIALYRPDGFSLKTFRTEIDGFIKVEFLSYFTAGVEIQTLYMEEQGDGYIWYSKYYCWQHSENIWLFCITRSDAVEGYEEVQKIVRQIKEIQ